jgi:epsilon-lactone hydrolase
MQSQQSSYYYQMVKDQLVLWNGMNIEQRRNSYEEVALKRDNFSKEVEVEPVQLGQVSGEWLIPHHQKSDGIIIHLHGGAFAVGNALTYRAIGSHLAEHAKCKVLMLNYSLCPEHPFPAALMDVVNTFTLLKEQDGQQKIALSGDSAGGNLAITATLYLQQHQLPIPDALGLMSPWTDLTMTNTTHQTKAHIDPYFPNSERLIAFAKIYAHNKDLKDPLISPQYASFANFPPVMTHVGEFEALLDDAEKFHQKAIADGVSSQLEIYPSMWHVWQHFVGLMPEATQSIQTMGHFLALHVH